MQQSSINIHDCEHRLVSTKDLNFAHFRANSSNTHAGCSALMRAEFNVCFLDFEIPRGFAFRTGGIKSTLLLNKSKVWKEGSVNLFITKTSGSLNDRRFPSRKVFFLLTFVTASEKHRRIMTKNSRL